MLSDLAKTSDLSISSSRNRAATAWVGRHLNPARANAIETYVNADFLDVGCGNGQYVTHFSDRFRTAGVDIQEYPQWNEYPGKFRLADAAKLPFENSAFEAIVSFETLEHVPDPQAVLREFHRVCTDKVIISVPNCELPPALEQSRLTYFHYTDRSHCNFFTREKLADALTDAGFTPLEVRLINPCPVKPLLDELFRLPNLLSRAMQKLANRNAFHMTLLAIAERRQPE